jgi:hypothetical protein
MAPIFESGSPQITAASWTAPVSVFNYRVLHSYPSHATSTTCAHPGLLYGAHPMRPRSHARASHAHPMRSPRPMDCTPPPVIPFSPSCTLPPSHAQREHVVRHLPPPIGRPLPTCTPYLFIPPEDRRRR